MRWLRARAPIPPIPIGVARVFPVPPGIVVEVVPIANVDATVEGARHAAAGHDKSSHCNPVSTLPRHRATPHPFAAAPGAVATGITSPLSCAGDSAWQCRPPWCQPPPPRHPQPPPTYTHPCSAKREATLASAKKRRARERVTTRRSHWTCMTHSCAHNTTPLFPRRTDVFNHRTDGILRRQTTDCSGIPAIRRRARRESRPPQHLLPCCH